jgi:hypothetical protein
MFMIEREGGGRDRESEEGREGNGISHVLCCLKLLSRVFVRRVRGECVGWKCVFLVNCGVGFFESRNSKIGRYWISEIRNEYRSFRRVQFWFGSLFLSVR